MNAHSNEAELIRHAMAIGVWENEGGAPVRDFMDHHYGRCVEVDGWWSVYHAFTGTPAEISDHTLTGMNRAGATQKMVLLNRQNEKRGRERDQT